MIKFKVRWLLGWVGVIFILTGLFSIITPLYSYVKIVRFSGLVLLLTGFALQNASTSSHVGFILEKRSMLVESIVDYLFGIILVFNPFLSFIAFPFIIGIWILLISATKIIVSILSRNKIRGWMFILFFGILSGVFAFIIMYAPLQKANEISRILGIFFITMGTVLIFDSLRLKKMHEAVGLLF